MRVLRSNEDLLLTLGEVLVHDPLKRWSIDPKFYTREGQEVKKEPGHDDTPAASGGEEDGEVLARNFLMKLSEKLQGRHGSGQQSVAGQVRHLIHQATRPENLSVMYYGWQAYL